MAPLSRRPLLGAFSSSRCALDGMFHMTQCTQVPTGASGSSTIKAKLVVWVGCPLQLRAGEISVPWQVYWLGMAAPEANAGLASVKVVIADGPPFGGLGCCAKRVAASRRIVGRTIRMRPLEDDAVRARQSNLVRGPGTPTIADGRQLWATAAVAALRTNPEGDAPLRSLGACR